MSSERKIVRLVKGRKVQCPVCGNDHGCAFIGDDYVLCLRVQDGCLQRDGRPMSAKNGMGWMHSRAGKSNDGETIKLPTVREPKRLTRAELESAQRACVTAMSDSRMALLSKELGVSDRSLRAFGFGFHAQTGCWSTPMYDGDRRIVGIRLRGEDGQKFSLPGGSNGLFIPLDYDPRPIHPGLCASGEPLVLLWPEGPTDAAAARDHGVAAIGRPSNTGGVEQACRLFGRLCGQEAVVVGENDGPRPVKDVSGQTVAVFFPGIEGALALAESLLGLGKGRVRFLMPPPEAKDLRQWLAADGSFESLMTSVLSSSLVTPAWIRAARARVEAKKQKALAELAPAVAA